MIRLPRAGALPLARTPLFLALALPLAAPLAPALAQTEREHGAHEHGAATIDVVLDGGALYVDLDSPADNLLGFEHAPSTDEQRDVVARVRELLESGELLVPDAAAGCALVSANVSMDFEEVEGGHADEHDDDHDEHGDEHAAERAAEHDDEHGDEHAAGEDEHETHSDIEAAWQFECDAPERLTRIETRLFDEFDGFADIDVQVAGPNGQTLVELSPAATAIELGSAP